MLHALLPEVVTNSVRMQPISLSALASNVDLTTARWKLQMGQAGLTRYVEATPTRLPRVPSRQRGGRGRAAGARRPAHPQ